VQVSHARADRYECVDGQGGGFGATPVDVSTMISLVGTLVLQLSLDPRMASPPIYLDYNATTPLAPEVCKAMGELLKISEENPLDPSGLWGNPSSGKSLIFGV